MERKYIRMNAAKKPMALVERHRPQTLVDIVGQDNVVAVLRGFVKRRSMPNLMLSGDSGVGKTSSALAFIRDFYAEFGITEWQPMVLLINASQENGIETIREHIKPFATAACHTNNACGASAAASVPKIIVLDEADQMTKVAQWALGPIIDKTSENARYIFIVNYLRRIQDDLQSRCEVLRFPPLSRRSVNQLISSVCAKEHVAFEQSAAAAIGVVAQSDMRKALNILSSCLLQKKSDNATPLTEAFVYTAAGRVEPALTLELMHQLLSSNLSLPETCARVEQHLDENNLSLTQVLRDVHEVALSLCATNEELDCAQRFDATMENDIRRRFANEDFAMAFFEQVDETEQHLLAITDAARMMVQTRAFAAGLWSIAQKYKIQSE
jgi:DNA polymerase III delta prime subunit